MVNVKISQTGQDDQSVEVESFDMAWSSVRLGIATAIGHNVLSGHVTEREEEALDAVLSIDRDRPGMVVFQNDQDETMTITVSEA